MKKKNLKRSIKNIVVAVAAYKAENGIKNIVYSLLSQKVHKEIDYRVLIHCDLSGDNSSLYANEIRDEKVKVIKPKRREGFAGSVQNILKHSKDADIVILLNDDIAIKDEKLIQKLTQQFSESDNVGLVGGNSQPIKPGGFIERAIESTFRAYEKMRYTIKNGHNKFTCDGKVLALSREFIDSLEFPEDKGRMGNVDAYLYFACLKNGYDYRHAEEAKVYYKNPSKIDDYVSWFVRNSTNKHILKEEFGEIVNTEYKTPRRLMFYKLIEAAKNPLGSLFVFFTSFYIKLKARYVAKNFNPLWDVVSTSKQQ